MGGSEPKRAPTKMCEFVISGSCFLEIVEGRATLFAPKAIDGCILQLKRESTQKFTKKSKENVKGRKWKREEEEQEQRQTRGRGAREALSTPQLPIARPQWQNTGSNKKSSASSVGCCCWA